MSSTPGSSSSRSVGSKIGVALAVEDQKKIRKPQAHASEACRVTRPRNAVVRAFLLGRHGTAAAVNPEIFGFRRRTELARAVVPLPIPARVAHVGRPRRKRDAPGFAR